MSSITYSIILVAIAALVTFLIRWAPFAVFGGNRQMPSKAKQVADLIPPAIMAVLVIFCIKSDIVSLQSIVVRHDLGEITGIVSTVIALVTVVLVHLWKRQTLLSIALGTVVYMLLIRVLPTIM